MARSVQKGALQPVGVQLRALRQEKKWSLEDLAFATREHGGRLTFSYIGQVERGEQYPTEATLELLAKALEIRPEVFTAYRLARARRLFDERKLGLAAASRNLEALAEGVASELARLVEEVAPAGPAGARAGSDKR